MHVNIGDTFCRKDLDWKLLQQICRCFCSKYVDAFAAKEPGLILKAAITADPNLQITVKTSMWVAEGPYLKL